MAIADPLSKARAVNTGNQATKLYDRLVAQQADDSTVQSGKYEDAAGQAIELLEDRWGLPDTRTDYALGSQPRAAESPEQREPAEPRATSLRPAASSSRPRARRRGGSGRAAFAGSFLGSRSFKRTGIPGGAATATGISLQAVGIFFGLTLLYLVVSDRGSKGLSTLIGGVTSAVTLLVAPVDPFAPGTLDAVSGTKAPAAKPVKPGAASRSVAGVGAGAVALAGRAHKVPARRAGLHVPHPI